MAKVEISKSKIVETTFLVAGIMCLMPMVSSAVALLTGMVIALTLGNPFPSKVREITPKLLQFSVVGLGAGMNLKVIGEVGAQGVTYTVIGIVFTILIGLLLGNILRTQRNISLLLCVGTAICGGSAIAAAAVAIRAKAQEVSVALATVFFLNASALLVFPAIGHYFLLDERQFGLWSALAIHDTSSVVGAAAQYGQVALEIATTVKLARALWIIPITTLISLMWRQQESAPVKGGKKYPWFILWFLVAAAIVTWIPELKPFGAGLSWLAKRSLVLTLFLIGASISREIIKNVGMKPFAQGLSLWILVSVISLTCIRMGLIL